MKPRWLTLMLFILCLWPVAIHLAVPQAKPIPTTPIQADIILADMNMNQMCHIAADFGYDAAEEGTSREDMHQKLKETLK
jgi:hypothetical protein